MKGFDEVFFKKGVHSAIVKMVEISEQRPVSQKMFKAI